MLGMAKICDKCKSVRMLFFNGNTKDCYMCKLNPDWMKIPQYEGYPIAGINFGDDGENIYATVCMECGKVQGTFPVTDKTIKTGFASG